MLVPPQGHHDVRRAAPSQRSAFTAQHLLVGSPIRPHVSQSRPPNPNPTPPPLPRSRPEQHTEVIEFTYTTHADNGSSTKVPCVDAISENQRQVADALVSFFATYSN
jgi:hypothetical protein